MTKLFIGIGVLIGLLVGFGYWYYVGCYSGTCPITSNWHISSMYGGIMGGLLGNIGHDFFKKKEE